jgi:thiosulfate dehydrogenase (quinone) large subunit
MSDTNWERTLIVFFRLAMGWTFLYAASQQVGDPDWSVVAFLNNTKTFHYFFQIFTMPMMAPTTSFIVQYGHLLIGLSLISGLMVRVSAPFGIMLMLIYWMAHMDWPYIENKNNFILDYHIVYAGVLAYLVVKRAGHVLGLDGLIERHQLVERHPILRPLVHGNAKR